MKLKVSSGGGDSKKKTSVRVIPPNIAAPASSSVLDNPFRLGLNTSPQIQAMSSSVEQVNPEDNEPKIAYKDPKGLKSGKYSKKHIEGIVKASQAIGIDPYQALALGLQESGFANKTGKKGRRGGAIIEDLAQVMDFEPSQEKEMNERAASSGIDPQYLKLAIVLRDKMKYAKQLGFSDEAAQLQAYNGYGTITKRMFGGADKAYGVPIGEGIDMKKNPLYGKRLIELKQGFMDNPEIQGLIKAGAPPPPAATQVPANSIVMRR